MSKIKKIITVIIAWFIIIVADWGVFGFLGLPLMGYEDNYNSSKGEFLSLASMNTTEKTFYISHNIWIILNIIGLICICIYIGKYIYKRIKKSQ